MNTTTATKTHKRHALGIDISRLEMMRTYLSSLMDEANQKKMMELSFRVLEPIYNGATRTNPKSVFINNGSDEDIAYVRKMALELGEEFKLATDGHTCHFDGPNDQGRDTANTKYLAHADTEISSLQKKEELQVGIAEARNIITDIMKTKEMIISFISRGPIGSPVLIKTDFGFVLVAPL